MAVIAENIKFNFGVVSQQKEALLTDTNFILGVWNALFNGVYRDAKDIAGRVVAIVQHGSNVKGDT